jgi:hypothetical protein
MYKKCRYDLYVLISRAVRRIGTLAERQCDVLRNFLHSVRHSPSRRGYTHYLHYLPAHCASSAVLAIGHYIISAIYSA